MDTTPLNEKDFKIGRCIGYCGHVYTILNFGKIGATVRRIHDNYVDVIKYGQLVHPNTAPIFK